ncbi:MAG: hypothetical protein ACI8UO_002606 [Verrucomicrobiales bacterium]|jgi:hypothetical protein
MQKEYPQGRNAGSKLAGRAETCSTRLATDQEFDGAENAHHPGNQRDRQFTPLESPLKLKLPPALLT